MRGQNPYTLAFGREPGQLIARPMPEEEVIESFCADEFMQQLYVITGVRGSGKTVFLSRCAQIFRKKQDWIVVELNSNRDLLVSLVSKLSSENRLAELFRHAHINLSFFGSGLEVSDAAPIADVEVALTRMLQSIQSQGKRVLVEIDEVSNTQTMREFASAFQILIRQKLPIFLLATGLYENVRDLQNEDNLTFLYRAPKIELGPLNAGAIAENYQATFGIPHREALEMARLTRGYSFAFQLLGYLVWRSGKGHRDVIPEYRQYLESYVYEKVWSELSPKDREVAGAIAASPEGKVADIRERLGMASGQFSPYRKRLLDKGIIVSEGRGYVSFALPLFEEFVRDQSE